jgi:hypothetical protein
MYVSRDPSRFAIAGRGGDGDADLGDSVRDEDDRLVWVRPESGPGCAGLDLFECARATSTPVQKDPGFVSAGVGSSRSGRRRMCPWGA